MEEDERYRVESPDEKEKSEHSLAKPLPITQEPITIGKKATPIVTFLGISMKEKRKEWILMVLIPALVGVIDCAVLMYQVVFFGVINAGFFIIVCFTMSLPVGILQPTSGRALTSGFLNSLFFCIFSLLFLTSPALYAPFVIPYVEVFITAMLLIVGYFVIALPSCILGSYFGHIIREIL
jgi:hypothetical protein